jgi:WD40 repeat protein
MSVAFSADGRYLVSGSYDKTVKLWDLATGQEQQTFRGHAYAVWSVAFSADGCYIASGSYDHTIKIWDVRGEERITLKGHSDIITSVAFSLDGRYLASGSHDKTIRIWDTTTGKEQQALEIGTEVRTLSFDAAASYLYTEIGLIKYNMEHGNKAQPMIPDSDPAKGQYQRQSNDENAQKANYKYVGYGISTDKCWITWNGQNILWLPPDYQPSSESAIGGYGPHNLTSPEEPSADIKIAMRNDSGRVTMVRMPRSGPYPLV